MGANFMLILSIAAIIGAAQALPQELVSFLTEIRGECVAKSGSDEGYNLILNSIQPAKDCVLSQIDTQQLEIDVKIMQMGARKPFFDKYCPKLNQSINCFDGILEGLVRCAGEATNQVMNIMKDAAHNLLTVLCKNNGQILFDTQKPEFGECFDELTSKDFECVPSKVITETSIAKYGRDQCRELDSTLKCVRRKMDDCEDPGLFKVIKSIADTISKANNCKQYTRLGEVTANNIDENSIETHSDITFFK